MPEVFDFPIGPTGAGGSEYGNKFVNVPDPQPGVRFANPGRRSGAILIDEVVPWIVLTLSNDLVGFGVLILMIYNMVWLQGTTGQSIGKKAFGLALAYVPEDARTNRWSFIIPGPVRCVIRLVLHVLDLILLIGFFRMLLNPESRSFSDSLCSTLVIHDDRVELESKADYLRRVRR